MHIKYWNVLAVDDEEDVLNVTSLALKRMQVFGIPIKLHTASSKADAIKWLETNPEAKALHLALIDAVMETDHAGLELCEYIRSQKELNCRIILRTGQAGKVPEREVVNKYDITGYLGKTEATEDKLYSVVTCCVKEAYQAHHMGRASR